MRLFEQRGRPHKLSVPLPNEMPHDDEEEEEDEDEDEDEESEDGSNRGERLPHGASAAVTWPAGKQRVATMFLAATATPTTTTATTVTTAAVTTRAARN